MSSASIYLAGLEVQFQSKEHLVSFIISQATTKQVADIGYTNSKVEFSNGLLSKYVFLEEGKETKIIELQPALKYLEMPIYKANTPKLIEFNKNGLHQLGGAYPIEFNEPEHDGITPFVYIGFINNKDPLFSWLPFVLHIAFPIFAHVVPLYFDYTNPSKPVILNMEDVNSEHSNFEPFISKNSKIQYESLRLNFKESISFYNEDGNTFAHAGLPNYSQQNPLPKSPKTNKQMPFVCQLNKGVKMKYCDIAVTEEYYKDQLKELNFWGDANLYIYFEVETNIMCALISH